MNRPWAMPGGNKLPHTRYNQTKKLLSVCLIVSNEYVLSLVIYSGDRRYIFLSGAIKQEKKKGRSRARGPCG